MQNAATAAQVGQRVIGKAAACRAQAEQDSLMVAAELIGTADPKPGQQVRREGLHHLFCSC